MVEKNAKFNDNKRKSVWECWISRNGRFCL